MAVQPSYAADAVISGTVKRATDNTPVYLQYMYAENTATAEQDYGVTNAEGNYSITIADGGSGTAGTYTIYNTYYNAGDSSVYFVKQTQNVTLVDGETKNSVNFSLDQQGKITGHVYTSDGVTPIYSSSILASSSIAGTVFYGSDVTTAAGYYVAIPYSYNNSDIANDGSYLVTTTALGYFGASQTVSVNKNSATTANFTLTRGSTVTGKISTTAGVGIEGATALLTETGTSRTYTATTNSSGNYSISVYDATDYGGTAVGYYSLAASATNYVSQSSGVRITTDDSTLSANNFSLATAGSITGTTYQSDGTSVLAAVSVRAEDGFGNNYSTTSASNGTFTLNNLRTSTNYTVTVSKDGYVTQKAHHVTVSAGETTSGKNFNLATAVTFSGAIVDKSSSQGIEGASIYLYNLAKIRYGNYYQDYLVTSYTNGVFTVPNIAPGVYRIRVVKAGYVTARDRKVNITSSVSDATYAMGGATSIFGKVTHRHQPVYNALVIAYSSQDSDVGYGSAYTDTRGFYTIPSLKAGTYLLKITSTGYADKTVKRTIKKNTTRVNINVGPSGTVSGFVYDASTQLPLAGYSIRVRNQATVTSTDGNGFYTLDGLAPGNYSLYVTSSGHETSSNKAVKVKSNKETKNVNFTLTPKT